MNCPSCLQTIENHCQRCPFCQATIVGRMANIAPPRASDREYIENAGLQVGQAERTFHGYLAALIERVARWIPPRIRRFPHSEVWLSLLFPGLGHIFLGWTGLGLLIMGASAIMLGFLVVLALDPGAPGTTTYLFWFGVFLGICHSHAVLLANRQFPDRPKFTTPALNLTILVVLVGQLNLLGWTLYGARYRMNVRGIRLEGHFFRAFQPIFNTGDFLDVNPVAAANLRLGDLVMIDRYTLDRVIGLDGDILKIQEREILRNGSPLPGRQQPVTTYNTQREIPYPLSQTPVMGEGSFVKVNKGEAGILYWGRQLRSIPIGSLQGRIDGILNPPERACRFVNGVRTSR